MGKERKWLSQLASVSFDMGNYSHSKSHWNNTLADIRNKRAVLVALDARLSAKIGARTHGS
jgi:hypothetical protein